MINLERLRDYPLVAPDVETTGKHWYRDKMFGLALAVWDGDQIHSAYWDVREKPRILEAVGSELKYAKKVINHNVKFDTHFLLNEKIEVPLDRLDCTGVRAALINEHEGHNGRDGFDLDSLCRKYIGEGKVDIWSELATLFGGAATRSAQITNLHRAPSALAAKYATPDPALALKLWLWQEKEIERQGIQQICDLERRLLPILVQIERQGIKVDVELATNSRPQLEIMKNMAQEELNRLAGRPINVASTPQMRELFGVWAETLNLNGVERKIWRTKEGTLLDNTDTGGCSLDKDAMMRLDGLGDARAKFINAIRKADRADLFLKNHILGHHVNGYVYPNYNQTRGDNEKGTGTGRFSIDDPAMQQIPMHDRDVAAIVRPCFLPPAEFKWGCADWKQFEFRWFAHYTKDPGILKTYAENPNADFHQITADITGITRDRKFAGDTANAKQINLGLVFGMGEGEMAYNMGMEYELVVDKNKRERKIAGSKAKEIFRKYHAAIPGVKALLEQASSIARARGHVRTAMGRHIRFPGGKFLHKAGGLTFQGTSADCLKYKMIELWPICKAEGWQYMLSVHDEHDVAVPEGQVKDAESKLRDVLETFDGVRCPIKCRIPILSDIAFGNNWWEACK